MSQIQPYRPRWDRPGGRYQQLPAFTSSLIESQRLFAFEEMLVDFLRSNMKLKENLDANEWIDRHAADYRKFVNAFVNTLKINDAEKKELVDYFVHKVQPDIMVRMGVKPSVSMAKQ